MPAPETGNIQGGPDVGPSGGTILWECVYSRLLHVRYTTLFEMFDPLRNARAFGRRVALGGAPHRERVELNSLCAEGRLPLRCQGGHPVHVYPMDTGRSAAIRVV